MRRKIVIIGANVFQNPLILKCKELGYETHVFAWRDGSIGERTADFFYPISIVEIDKIYQECKRINPDAIVSIASDLASITVNEIARRLGLPCNSAECVNVTTNKYEMRKRLLENDIPTPVFHKVYSGQKIDFKSLLTLPVIVKPTDRSGSRGVTKIDAYEEIGSAVDIAVHASFEKAAIIEEFIDGEEFSCECISYKGEHQFLTITKKYTTGAPKFIEVGHIEPAALDIFLIEKVKNTVFSVLEVLGIENGASHTEFKIDKNGEVRIIEIGARMGGDGIGTDLVPLSTGYDYLKMVIDVAIGKSPDFTQNSEPINAGAIFIFNEGDYNRLKVLEEVEPSVIRHKSEISMVETVLDSSSRWGFYIVANENWNKIVEQLECR